MEPLKRGKVLEEVNRLYPADRVKNGLVLLGNNKYCMLEGSYKELERRRLQLRTDDIWIGGFARSGTRWLAELTWLVTSNLDVETAVKTPFSDRVHYYDYGLPMEHFEKLLSPRYLHTHLPLSMLPPRLLETSKMVYIIRDPRDIIVSLYYFFKDHKNVGFIGDVKCFYKAFKEGNVVYTPYFKNIMEFYAKRDHPNILFLFYEDMKKEQKTAVQMVSEFFNRSYSNEELDKICDHLQFSKMKVNKSMNNTDCLENADQIIRKGEAGGWRNEFDDEMSDDAKFWIDANLVDEELRLRYCL